MKYWRCSLLVFLAFISCSVNAQNARLQLVNTVSVNASILEVDNIGNVFAIRDGKIFKYDLTGKLLMKNSAMAFGQISSLDASNALKMIAFFKDLSQVIYLDNLLATRGQRIELDVLGYFQTTAVCRSYNDGFWLYDQTTFELTRLTEQLEVTAQSGNLAQILGFVPEPNYMRENNNWLYVNDPNHGVLVFDWYGSYTKTIPVLNLTKFAIRANKLFFVTDGFLESYDLKTSEFAKITLPDQKLNDFSIFEDKLVVITENQLKIYRIIVE